jgi:hypothetical protein
MSSSLVNVLVALTKGASINTPTGAASAGTSVVITDSTGAAQAPVVLTGAETPTPWAFTTNVAVGAGTVVTTDVDVNGATLGTPITQTFSEAGTPPTFSPTTAISVTPTASTAAVAAVRAAAKR